MGGEEGNEYDQNALKFEILKELKDFVVVVSVFEARFLCVVLAAMELTL